MIFLGIFAVLLQLVYSQKTSSDPTISVSLVHPTVNIGGTVVLSCTVQDLQNYTVIWQKVDKDRAREPINLFIGVMKLIPEDRFTLRHDPSSLVHNLEIKDIKDSDTGFYRCAITITSEKQISKEINLLVRVPPVIENITSSITVPLHNATKLECYANGQPEPNVTWTRENGAVLPTGGHEYIGNVLRIMNVSKEHAGIYYCNANNNVSSSVKKSVKLEVEFAPVVQVSKNRVGQALTYDAELKCSASGFPTPVIVWIKDFTPLTKDQQHYMVAQYAIVDEYTTSTLNITSVESAHYGNYTCKAANRIGEDRAVIEFYETSDKECFQACDSGLVEFPNFKLIVSTSVMAIVVFVRW